MGLQFGPGVMPKLRRFKLIFGAKQTEDKFGDFDFGIENLIFLEEVSVTINCSTHALEAAIRDQVSKIPNNPLLDLRSVLAECNVPLRGAAVYIADVVRLVSSYI
nr:uncharacterized protein LOC117856027 isoform X2 [Setaria viridis]